MKARDLLTRHVAVARREETLLAAAQRADAYNAKLGMKRAEAIKQLLVENGIAAERIEIVSEGERGAVGGPTDDAPYSYGYDRRVDVVVRGGTHAP